MKNVLILILAMVTLVNVGCGSSKRTYIAMPTAPAQKAPEIASCDRGVDYESSGCNRSIEDRTFWMGSQPVEVSYKSYGIIPRSEMVKVSMAYEFSPPTREASVGNFKRAVFMRDPKSEKVLGYLESGYITRVSHEAIDFVVTYSSCYPAMLASGGDQALDEHKNLEESFTFYYERNKEKLLLSRNEQDRNPLTIIMSFPFYVIREVVSFFSSFFTDDYARKVFDSPTEFNAYQFSMDLLPVEWGCSVKGDFRPTNQDVPKLIEMR